MVTSLLCQYSDQAQHENCAMSNCKCKCHASVGWQDHFLNFWSGRFDPVQFQLAAEEIAQEAANDPDILLLGGSIAGNAHGTEPCHFGIRLHTPKCPVGFYLPAFCGFAYQGSGDGIAVYSRLRIIELYVRDWCENLDDKEAYKESWEEAQEHFEYNTRRASDYAGPRAPMYIDLLEDVISD